MHTLKVNKVLVVLSLQKKSVIQLIASTKHYLLCMTGNAYFPNPSPALSIVAAQVVALEAAYLLAKRGLKGNYSAMRVSRDTLEMSLKILGNYVETEANKYPDLAVGIIQSAGMVIKKSTAHQPKVFSVVQSPYSGAVKLSMKATRGASYLYDMSLDPTQPFAWIRLGTFNRVKYLKSGLAKGSLVYFRAATVHNNEQSNWSPVVDIVVN